MAEDTKTDRNQQSGSPAQPGQGNPSNATKQPGGQSSEQRGQEGPTKDTKKGDQQKQENQKTGKR